MKCVRRVLLGLSSILALALAGAGVYAFSVGYPPAERPDLATALPTGVPAPPPGYPTELTSMAGGLLLHPWSPIFDKSPAPGVAEVRDIEFGRGGGSPLYLDLYSPQNLSTTAPGVVLLYGGGWQGGDKDQLRQYAQYLAQHGYVVAASSYRLKAAGLWPNSVADAKCAVRWLRAHATERHVDPDRIGVMGNSAGGYLALMLGYTAGVPEFEGDGGWPEASSAVQAVVDIYGPADFTLPPFRDHGLVLAYMNGKYAQEATRYEKASPIRYVSTKSPPTCIMHGTVDMLVPVGQSDALAEVLKKNNVPYVYSRIDGWPHVMDLVRPVGEHMSALAVAFLDEHLKRP